jgi:hypothetical protein
MSVPTRGSRLLVARVLLGLALATALVGAAPIGAPRATSQAAPAPTWWTCSLGDTNCSSSAEVLAPMPTARTRLGAATGPDGRIYAMGGSTNLAEDPAVNTVLPTVEAYDPSTNTWACSIGDINCPASAQILQPMPTGRDRFGTAVGPDGLIYVIGGYDGGTAAAVEAYDPVRNTWTCSVGDTGANCTARNLAPLPTARSRLGAATGPDGRIYAVGGYDGRNYLATVEAYDPRTNSWTPLAGMPTARGALGVATGGDGRIYAVGGWLGSDAATYNVVEAYDPVANTWATVAPVSAARRGLATVNGPDGQIYAIGGCEGTALGGADDLVEAYSLSRNRWTVVTHMPTARTRLAAATGPDQRIYAIGGLSNKYRLSSVEAYTVPRHLFLPRV